MGVGVDGVPKGRCAILPAGSQETGIVAIVERESGEWVEPAVRMLRRESGRGTPIRILTGAPGTILRTSSGKPRRRVIWQALLDGQIDVTAAYDDSERIL